MLYFTKECLLHVDVALTENLHLVTMAVSNHDPASRGPELFGHPTVRSADVRHVLRPSDVIHQIDLLYSVLLQ